MIRILKITPKITLQNHSTKSLYKITLQNHSSKSLFKITLQNHFSKSLFKNVAPLLDDLDPLLRLPASL